MSTPITKQKVEALVANVFEALYRDLINQASSRMKGTDPRDSELFRYDAAVSATLLVGAKCLKKRAGELRRRSET